MLKIYFNDKPLFITDQITAEIKEWANKPQTIIIRELSISEVNRAIQSIREKETPALVFLYPDEQAVLSAFRLKFNTIQAAGGFIYNEDGDVLLIFRRGKWDMPKGKLDDGEDLPACAVREVQEETGLVSLDIQAHLFTTYHTYEQRGEAILKESFWYLMKGSKHDILAPQTDEDIEHCEWVKASVLFSYTEGMHASLPDVVQAGLQQLEHLQH